MESQFTAKDFNGFKYQKILSHKQDVIRSYPELKRHPEFNASIYKKKRLSHDKIFKYVLLVYTNNILFESIPSMVKRKREAALLAGFSPNPETDTFPGDLELIIKCEDVLVNELIIKVIRLNKDGKWQQYCAFEEARAKQIEKMVSGVDFKDKEQTSTIMKNIRELSGYIDELQNDLLNQDEQVDIIELLYENIISDNLGLRPEDIAMARKNGTIDKILRKPSK